MRSLLLDVEYNRGAGDMALLFIEQLRFSKGKIVHGINQKHIMQFLDLLEDYVTAPGLSAMKMLEDILPPAMNFRFVYDREGNMIAIKLED